MKKLLINLSVAGLIVSCAGLAQAETPEAAHQAPVKINKMKTLKHDLNLTKEQKEKIKGIRKDFNTKILALRKKIQDNNKSLRKLMLTQYSESELDKLADARGKLVADTVKIRFHFKKAVHEVLTSEQKDKIKKLQAERLKHLKK